MKGSLSRSKTGLFSSGVLALCVLLSSLAAAPAAAELIQAKLPEVHIACFDMPPIFMAAEDGHSTTGKGVNILKLAFESIGYRAVFHHMPQPRALRSVIGGEAEGYCAGAKDFGDLSLKTSSEPYYQVQTAFYQRKQAGWDYEGMQSITQRTLVSVKGFDYRNAHPMLHRYLETRPPNVIMLHGSKPWERMVSIVLAGRADTAMMGVDQANYVMRKLGATGQIVPVEGYRAFSPAYVAFSRQSSHLQPLFDQALRDAEQRVGDL
jgi:ABC-type amino acid transport substrate-binding protein